MEEKIPLIKRLDTYIFTQLDEFRKTPGHAKIIDFYGSLEDESQKVFKWLLLASTFIIPFLLVAVIWWQNSAIENELNMRIALVERMQQIITQNSEVGGLSSSIAAPTAFTSQDELSGRLSSTISSVGLDISKIRINGFTSEVVSPLLTRSEADFKFDGVSTDQLMGLLTALLQRERFRISAVQINRNNEANLLEGSFHGVHFGETQLADEE
jgi:hypothetical protein